VLSLLDEDTKIEAIKQLKERGSWPTTIDYSSLLKRMDDFVAVAHEDHENYQRDMAIKAMGLHSEDRERAKKKKIKDAAKAKRKEQKDSRKKNR